MTLSVKFLSSPPIPALVPVAIGDNFASPVVMTYVTGLYNATSTPDATVFLVDLQDSQYSLKKPIYVTLKQEDDDEYIACFEEAALSRSGDTPKEAIAWLKSSIVTVYDSLRKRDAKALGPLPSRQLNVLGEYLGSVSDPKA